eukprot:CAMPEP_0201285766 /NCGR_PEP_ID=MMETSP1317-20130820/113780_1 /ASSEMBLY_ACC=CAM_ASM_000770 /TAXON_ID=187299 /ORGANISM="Undescribed Undescribed, Strain Undescribed" /LENGTH=32 /DNA_ID= /DNA_START= /DNA_END= /DNA_ORIENTATION=
MVKSEIQDVDDDIMAEKETTEKTDPKDLAIKV